MQVNVNSPKNLHNARRCVSQRAPCSDEKCPMRLILFLTNNNQWYLHTSSCLSHRHHPHLGEHAILLSQKDLSDKEQKLINVLMDQNVAPSKISKIVSTLKDDDMGTFLPKTIFNINEKCRSLIDIANGILPSCTDAEKTLHYLKQWVCFVIMLPCKFYSKSAHPCYMYTSEKILIIIVSCMFQVKVYLRMPRVVLRKRPEYNWSVLIQFYKKYFNSAKILPYMTIRKCWWWYLFLPKIWIAW